MSPEAAGDPVIVGEVEVHEDCGGGLDEDGGDEAEAPDDPRVQPGGVGDGGGDDGEGAEHGGQSQEGGDAQGNAS